MPARIVLSQDQSSDKTLAPILLEGFKPERDRIPDRGHCSVPESRDAIPTRESEEAIWKPGIREVSVLAGAPEKPPSSSWLKEHDQRPVKQ